MIRRLAAFAVAFCILCFALPAAAQLPLSVRAKSGLSIPANRAFVFTGTWDMYGIYEVEYPADGAQPHGITLDAIDNTTPGNAYGYGLGPQTIVVSENVAAGASLTPSTQGRYRNRLAADTMAGTALLACTSGSNCPAILATSALSRASGATTATTSAPTYAMAAFATIAEMSVTLTTHGGDLSCTFSGSFDVRDNDNFNVALFVDGTEISNTRRQASYNSALILGITPGSIPGYSLSTQGRGSSLTAASHTVTAQWSRTGGTARAVGTNRRLDCQEVL